MHLRSIGGAYTSRRRSELHCDSFETIGLVTAFVKAEGCGIGRGDCTSYTPPLWAAENRHDGVVKLLLGPRNLDPDRPDKENNTPLMWGAHNGMKGLPRYFLAGKMSIPGPLRQIRIIEYYSCCCYELTRWRSQAYYQPRMLDSCQDGYDTGSVVPARGLVGRGSFGPDLGSKDGQRLEGKILNLKTRVAFAR